MTDYEKILYGKRNPGFWYRIRYRLSKYLHRLGRWVDPESF